MDFSTLPPPPPPFNATFSGDLLPEPSSNNETSEAATSTDSTRLIIAVCISALYSVICVVGLVGNVLVMYGVARYTKMKTSTNVYIFNLALADALATSTLPFQSAKYLMSTWPFGEPFCKIVVAIDYYNMFTSIFTLAMMSVDRYVAVCHPVRALHFRTPARARLINVCVWGLSSVVCVPVMIMAITKETDKGNTACTLRFPTPERLWDAAMRICVFIFAFVFPVLVITVCYALTIARLKSLRLLSGSKEKDKSLRRITRMVLVVVAAFVVCWAPIHIFIIVRTTVDIDHRNPLVTASWHLCIALGYANSSLNPVLYGFLDKNFERCFRRFCWPRRSGPEHASISRTRDSTREPVSVCAPARMGRRGEGTVQEELTQYSTTRV